MKRGIERRLLIGGLAVAPVAAATGARVSPATGAPDPLAALPAWLDTLVPADTTPSAAALGFTQAHFVQGPHAASMSQLLLAGCAWLDNEARKRGGAAFSDLAPSAREEIAKSAAAAPVRSAQRAFFALTRDRAMDLYYARRESWPGLRGYRGPPQPEGYPDHDQAPV